METVTLVIVYQILLEMRQIAGPNVSLIRNVQTIWLVLIDIAKIHAQAEFVA